MGCVLCACGASSVAYFCTPMCYSCSRVHMVKNEEARTVLNGCGLPRFQLCSELFAIEAIDSLGVGSRSSSFRSGGGLRSIFRHLNGDDGLFRVLNVELNAFRQNNVLSEHLGAVG